MTEVLLDAETKTKIPKKDSLVEYTIVHRIKGRLRLKIPYLAQNQDYANELEWLILKNQDIKKHRINNVAASLIVFYDWQTNREAFILNDLFKLIQAASQRSNSLNLTKDTNFGLPVLAMITAILAIPLELPFLVVGCSIAVAAVPLWQRVSTSVTNRGELTVESLDALWLTAQLIQGNGLAGALALNFSQAGETLRKTKIKPLEKELYIRYSTEVLPSKAELFFEEEENNGLSEQENLIPVERTDVEKWVQSVEETEFLQDVKNLAQKMLLPTILLSSVTLVLTNDLGRAAAWLPLDLGVSLQGVTPLAVDTALTESARSGVYIRNGKTLEQLAQIDTLVLYLDSEELVFSEQDLQSLSQELDLHIVTLKPWTENLPISTNLHLVSSSPEVDLIIQTLQNEGHKVAWVVPNTEAKLSVTLANVIISLALGGEQESQADVIFSSHDLRYLADTLTLAKQTVSIAFESLAIAIAGNIAAVGGGVIFGLDPIIAVLLNGGAAILGELNSVRCNQID